MKKIFYVLFALLISFYLSPLSFGQKPIELKIAHHGPTYWIQQTEVLEPWAKKIELLTEGKVKFKFFPNETLGKAAEHYDLTIKGTTDIALGLPDYTPGRFPLISCIKLPFLGIQNGEKASLVLWHLYQKYLQEEFKDTKVLWMFCNGPFQLHTINKEVKTIEDLKGLRLRIGDSSSAKVVEMLGAITVSCTAPDGYKLMAEGKLDGTVIPWEGALNFKYLDLCKYHTIINMYAMPFFVVMNKEKYESLPENIKKIIDENSGEKMALLAGIAMDNGDIKGKKLAEERGDVIYSLSQSEGERWRQMTMSIGDRWIEEMEAKGLPGQEVLTCVVNTFVQLQE